MGGLNSSQDFFTRYRQKTFANKKKKKVKQLLLIDLNIWTLILLKGEKCENLKWEMLFVSGKWDSWKP